MHSISPDGELLITLLAMYAEEEARSASENQRWKIRKKFEAGEAWVGNMLGYRLIDGEMVIIPKEAEIVRNIFSDYQTLSFAVFAADSTVIKFGITVITPSGMMFGIATPNMIAQPNARRLY